MTPINVLFLCTHNSARSVMAECLLDRLGQERFRSFSAGSQPSGRINPAVAQVLSQRGFATDALRSKSWDDFAQPDAPAMDVVVTVCDAAAGESCPIWPGQPVKTHWSFPDPSAATGDEAAKIAYAASVFERIEARLRAFVALPCWADPDPQAWRAALADLAATPA